MGALCPLSVVSGRAAAGMDTTASLQAVPQDVFGTSSVLGARQLVCAGGAPLCARSLAVRRHFLAADGDPAALLAGTSRALADVATAGSQWAGAVLFVGQHGASLAGWGRQGCQRERRR